MMMTGDGEMDRRSTGGDGYVMITPRSERAAWPNLNSDLNALDYPMTFTGMNMGGGGSLSGWMGQEGLSPLIGGGMSGSGPGEMGDGMGGKNHELDFFSF